MDWIERRKGKLKLEGDVMRRKGQLPQLALQGSVGMDILV